MNKTSMNIANSLVVQLIILFVIVVPAILLDYFLSLGIKVETRVVVLFTVCIGSIYLLKNLIRPVHVKTLNTVLLLLLLILLLYFKFPRTVGFIFTYFTEKFLNIMLAYMLTFVGVSYLFSFVQTKILVKFLKAPEGSKLSKIIKIRGSMVVNMILLQLLLGWLLDYKFPRTVGFILLFLPLLTSHKIKKIHSKQQD